MHRQDDGRCVVWASAHHAKISHLSITHQVPRNWALPPCHDPVFTHTKSRRAKKKGFAATIERRFLAAILLTHESSPEVKYDVVNRLNTGGVIAAQMEVRHAIFPGGFNTLPH